MTITQGPALIRPNMVMASRFCKQISQLSTLPQLQTQPENQRGTGDWSSKAMPSGTCICNLEYILIISYIGALRTRHKCRWYCPNAAIRLADSIQLNFSLPKALYESGGALT